MYLAAGASRYARPAGRVAPEQRRDQLREVGILHRGDQAVEVLTQLGDRARRAVEQVPPRHLQRRAKRLDRDLAAVAGVLAHTPGHVYGVAGRERRGVEGVPQYGGDSARSVGERQAQVQRAVALAASIGPAHEQHAVDGIAVAQIADELWPL